MTKICQAVTAAILLLAAPAAAEPEFRARGDSLPLSEAVQMGDTLYLSGQLGIAVTGGLEPGGIGPETHRVMQRIGNVLGQYGLSHDALFKCAVMLADIGDYAAFNEAYGGYFKPGRYPARSVFAVSGLVLDARVEVECVASIQKTPTHPNADALAGALSLNLVPAPQEDGVVLHDFRPRIAPLGEGEWMYLQRNRGDTPYRQRVLQLIDAPDGSVRQIAWTFKKPERFAGAPDQPGILDELDISMLEPGFNDGCEQIWQRDNEREAEQGVLWTGRVDPETCVIFSQRRQKQIRIGAEARLTTNSLAEAERGFTMDGEHLWGTPIGEWALLMRTD